jgi:hypothetical protein
MSRFSDGILLLYGLCGNSLGDIGNDLRDLSYPIYFLTDRDDKRVDDCIAVALGGNKRYEETLRGFPEVGFFFTPMWAFNWREIEKEANKSSKSQCLGSMLNSLGYQRVAMRIQDSIILRILGWSQELANSQVYIIWKSSVFREVRRS